MFGYFLGLMYFVEAEDFNTSPVLDFRRASPGRSSKKYLHPQQKWWCFIGDGDLPCCRKWWNKSHQHPTHPSICLPGVFTSETQTMHPFTSSREWIFPAWRMDCLKEARIPWLGSYPIYKPWGSAIWKGSHVPRSLGDENDHHGYLNHPLGWILQVAGA